MQQKSYVSEVVEKINRLPPILVTFEHGELQPGEVSGLRCTVLQKKTDDRQRLVAVATPHLQHSSRAPDDAGVATTFIAVRNRKTNKVRLIETECFTLSPTTGRTRAATVESDAVDVGAQYSQLSKSFGSKMAKRKQEQLERTTIHVDNLEQQLTQVTGDMKIHQEDLSFSNEQTRKELLPPFNENAVRVSEVYELANMLAPKELKSLDGICDEIIADHDSYSQYSPCPLFTSRLPGALASKDRNRLKALLYADCLAKFLKVTIKDLNKKDFVVCPYSPDLSNKILNNFTTGTGKRRNRPVTHRDKALCYIIVLGLIAGGFKLNLMSVVDSLHRIPLSKLQELRRFVGAVPVKEVPDTIMLSLPFPSMVDTPKRRSSLKKKDSF